MTKDISYKVIFRISCGKKTRTLEQKEKQKSFVAIAVNVYFKTSFITNVFIKHSLPFLITQHTCIPIRTFFLKQTIAQSNCDIFERSWKKSRLNDYKNSKK